MSSRIRNICHAKVALLVLLATSAAHGGTFTVSSGNEYNQLKSKLQAVQFLARATFGFTESDVNALATSIRTRGYKRALSEWIDSQIALPPTLHEPIALQLQVDDGWINPYTQPTGAPSALDYRDYAWWKVALSAPDQLRQRMAFALMQIVVINRDADIFNDISADSSRNSQGVNQPRYMGIVHYNDMLVRNAFSNYRTVLGDVAFHPVMGVFLTHIDNQKPSADGLLLPDENFAREILQLFTISEFRTDIGGVFVRDRAGKLVQNYTNEDIKALARVFTGLQYAIGDGSTSVNLHDPMAVRTASRHDFTQKILPTLNLTLPARSQSAANAVAEINDSINYIYQHPNVGPYVTRLLIQRLVMANPSTRYIEDVATVFNNDGQGNRGNLAAVAKAVLLHPDALNSQQYSRIRSGGGISSLQVTTSGTEYAKLVEPVVRYTQFIKVFGGQPVDPTKGIRLRPSNLDLNQLPYQAPSVFNYYRPDYRPSGFQNYTASRRLPNGELYSPETQIDTPVFANRFQNLMYRHLHNNVSSFNNLNFSTSFAAEQTLASDGMAADDFSELLERLDLLMCHGSLSDHSKSAINSALVTGHLAGNNNASELARLAIFGVFGAPESAIDK